MKETKYYCDMCGKEIDSNPSNCDIPVTRNIGKHGTYKTNLRIHAEENGGRYYDFCEDCKATIAVLLGGTPNVSKG